MTSKSSLQTQKMACGASTVTVSGGNTDSQQNSNHKSKGPGTANLNQLSSARQHLKNQNQHSFVITTGQPSLTGAGGHLFHMGSTSEPYPSQAAGMGFSHARVYQTDSSDQAAHGHLPPGQPASAFATIDQANAQGHPAQA